MTNLKDKRFCNNSQFFENKHVLESEVETPQKIKIGFEVESEHQIKNDSGIFKYIDFVGKGKLSTKELEAVKAEMMDWTFEEEREYLENIKESYLEFYEY